MLRTIFSEYWESTDSPEKSEFFYFYFAKTFLWMNVFKEKYLKVQSNLFYQQNFQKFENWRYLRFLPH